MPTWYYSKTDTAVKERITVAGTNNDNIRNRKLTFKKSASFKPSISKNDKTFIDNGNV